ncbi:hypothetical protein [Marinomonas sp. ef1]|uniref:hypothetical protein n=1 Tax=Marinomonas TaxID=28253 RepID=UPI000C28693E|nr:hypothetical protein [Marinomonas sp. ef1]
MKIDPDYLSLLLSPLEDNNVLTLKEYFIELERREIFNKKLDKSHKFETHVEYLASKKMISNSEGFSDLKLMGFISDKSGGYAILGIAKIMKVEKEEATMAQNFNIGTLNAQSAQLGNGNTQNVTINIQELVEKVAASGDKEAKGVLMKLLENPTISGVIGAGVSGLIGILGGG